MSRPLTDGHFSYGRYYAGQSLHLAGERHERRLTPRLCDDLLKRQEADGGSCAGDFNNDYATATALIALQAQDGKLLIMQPAKAEEKK